MMGRPEVSSGSKLYLFAVVATFTNTPFMPPSLSCLALLPPKELPKNNMQIKYLSQALPFREPHTSTQTSDENCLQFFRWAEASF